MDDDDDNDDAQIYLSFFGCRKCTRLEIHLLTALGLQVNNLWNCEKIKREKERKGESDKGKNLGMENQRSKLHNLTS
jgi:hypothetical protein